MMDPTKISDNQLLGEIGPLDFAILMVTNPARYANDVGSSGSKPAMLTGKGFYHYVGIVWDTVKRSIPVVDGPGLTIETVIRGIERTVFPSNPHATDIETARLHLGYLAPESAEAQSLNKLISLALVKDPFVESISGMSLLVLGALPFSFTKRTEAGDVVYRRIVSLLWEYESKKMGDSKEVIFHLRMQKAVTLLLDTLAARAKKEDLLAEEKKA
jgi:hypothetical protein